MPANHVLVNGKIEYSVGDSKMEELMRWLKKNGYKTKTQQKRQPSSESDYDAS